MIIGSHVEYNKKTGLLGSLDLALSYDANCFMIYTGPPQNTIRSEVDESLTKQAIEKMKENNIDINNVIVHAPYIINMANNENYDFNIRFLKEEIKRVNDLGLKKIVIHPGSHVGKGILYGIELIIKVLNECLDNEYDISILLETMSGRGTEIGSDFNSIKKIIDGITLKEKIGVCIDTCHINDAGYNVLDFDNVLDEFNNKVGLKYLKCVHINDSKNIIGSHKDRHENIGYGTIGFDNMLKIIYHDKLKDVPKILETPYIDNKPVYKEEIESIKQKKFNNKLK